MLTPDEPARLAALHNLAILDTMPEQGFDDITLLAAHICEVPIALVSLVDSARQWFKSRHGLDAVETPRDIAFCAHAILQPNQIFVVPDATQDPRFADNPLVTGDPSIRFYAGAPLVMPDGHALGTLCVIDRQWREISTAQKTALAALGRQVVAQLLLREALKELDLYRSTLEVDRARLAEESITDALTGLMNRRGFVRSLEIEVSRAGRHAQPISLLLLDVDQFKSFNDTFGHPEGDDALRTVAQILRSSVREYDIVARPGGEEFAVIAPNTDEVAAVLLAERFRQAIASAQWPRRVITVSVGITCSRNLSKADRLIDVADRALYQAKAEGRNRAVFLHIQSESLSLSA
jgi:diguanylate cyclase (GGDEF)-like protein